MKTKAVFTSFIAAAVISSAAGAFAQDTTGAQGAVSAPEKKSALESAMSVDYLIMNMRNWSSSRGVDMSRNIYLDGALKYQLLDSTFIKFRFKSNPVL